MASGHVNRINRPNTWLLRPGLRRAESPCQRGAVHTWHMASIRRGAMSVPAREADTGSPSLEAIGA